MIGETVGHYKILEKLGSGGMGEVWLAEDTRLERQVALKFLPYHAAQDENEKARFIQEAKAAARLKHQNIAQVYEIGEEGERLYIVMEYVEGGSLRDKLDEAKGRSLPLDDVLCWIQQSAEGLAEAHKQGIVHRDIKPDNLMLTESGQIKITDFGLARLETATRLTAAGATLGTVNYMSPEQVTGKEVDQRADLFSLGATFYELITGHRAFEGADANATYFAILNDQPDPIHRYRSVLPEGLDTLIDKLLEKDPSIRYQSATEIVSDVKRFGKESLSRYRTSLPSISLRERIKTIRGNTWIVLAIVVLAIVIQTLPEVAEFRRSVRLGYRFTRESSRGIDIDQLKAVGDVDAYLASVIIDSPEFAEEDLLKAIELAPTDASLNALMTWLRHRTKGTQDSIALVYARNAYRLDPDNGAYSFLVFIGSTARLNQIEAERALQSAISAPRFSLNWSKHASALYRAMLAEDSLHPYWSAIMPIGPISGLYTFMLKGYMGIEKGPRRGTSWPLAWEQISQEVRLIRAKEVEHLGYRILSDATGELIQYTMGNRIAELGIDTQLNSGVIDSVQTHQLQQRKQALLAQHMAIIRRSQALFQWFEESLVAGAWTRLFHGAAWYLLIWSLIIITVRTFVYLMPGRVGRRSSITIFDNCELAFLLVFLIGSLFYPMKYENGIGVLLSSFPIFALSVGVSCVIILNQWTHYSKKDYECILISKLNSAFNAITRLKARRFIASVIRIMSVVLVIILITCIALLSISLMNTNLGPYEVDFFLAIFPLVIVSILLPTLIWQILRKSIKDELSHILRFFTAISAILVLVFSLLLFVETNTFGTTIKKSLEIPSLSYIHGGGHQGF